MILHEKYNKIFELLLKNNPKAKGLFMEFYKKCPEEIRENLRKENINCAYDIDKRETMAYDIDFPDVDGEYCFSLTDVTLLQDESKFDTCEIFFFPVQTTEDIAKVGENENLADYIYGDFAYFTFFKNNNRQLPEMQIYFDIIHKEDGYYLVSQDTTVYPDDDVENRDGEIYLTKVELADVMLADGNKAQV